MTARAALVAAALLAATGASGCDPGSYQDFRSQLAERSCTRAVACGFVAPGERAQCSAPSDVLAIIGRDDFDVATSLRAGHMKFVPAGATRCLDAIAAAPCEEGAASESILLGCNNVVRPATPVGNACWSDRQCEGGRCTRRYPCPGQCDGWLPLGATCDVNGAPERTCDPTVHYCGTTSPPDAGTSEPTTCLRKKQRGEHCLGDVECSFGLVCSGGSCGDLPHPKEGDACAGTGLCDRDIYCASSGLCVKQLSAGQSCDAVYACGRGFACIGLRAASTANPTLVPGLCAPWLTTGAACEPTATVTGCPGSHYCNSTTLTCTPLVGPALGYNEVCGYGDPTPCGSGLACTEGRCADAGGRGAACATSDACRRDLGLTCISGTCDFNLVCQ